MQRRMRVTAELENWVARLNAQVNSVWGSSPAASTPRWLLGQIGFWVARPGLDAAYQRQLVALARSRRAVAGVATSRKRLELQVGELERRAETPGDRRSPVTGVTQDDASDQHYASRSVPEQLADLRRQYADMRAKEERITAASRRLMAEVNAFRAGQENTKAAYLAAEEAAKAVAAEDSQRMRVVEMRPLLRALARHGQEHGRARPGPQGGLPLLATQPVGGRSIAI